MKVIKSAVYKLDVVAECGCKATGEYLDASYKKSVLTPPNVDFATCSSHTGVPGIELLHGILREAVLKEAVDAPLFNLAPPSSTTVELRAPQNVAGAIPAGVEVGAGGSVSSTAIAPPAQVGTAVSRPAERGPRRDPLQGKKVSHVRSGSSGGSPAPRAATGSTGLMIGSRKVASSGGAIDIDFEDAADEDPDLTEAMENALPSILGDDDFELQD